MNQSWNTAILLPGKSYQGLVVVWCKGSVSRKYLEKAAVHCRTVEVYPERADMVWGSRELQSSIWGGGPAYNSNAYLNEYFAFICIHLKIK